MDHPIFDELAEQRGNPFGSRNRPELANRTIWRNGHPYLVVPRVDNRKPEHGLLDNHFPNLDDQLGKLSIFGDDFPEHRAKRP